MKLRIVVAFLILASGLPGLAPHTYDWGEESNAAGGPMRSTIGGTPMDPRQLARMKAAFRRQGGVLQDDADAAGILRFLDAGAATIDAKTILLRPGATRSAVFEEFIHTAQFRTGRHAAALERFGKAETVRLMEIEAAEKLLRNRHAWGIPISESLKTARRLRGLRRQGE